MRAGLALAVTTLIASPAFTANEEWPGWPEKRILSRAGKRIDARALVSTTPV